MRWGRASEATGLDHIDVGAIFGANLISGFPWGVACPDLSFEASRAGKGERNFKAKHG